MAKIQYNGLNYIQFLGHKFVRGENELSDENFDRLMQNHSFSSRVDLGVFKIIEDPEVKALKHSEMKPHIKSGKKSQSDPKPEKESEIKTNIETEPPIDQILESGEIPESENIEMECADHETEYKLKHKHEHDSKKSHDHNVGKEHKKDHEDHDHHGKQKHKRQD
jgi:hypothetical protein